MGSVNPIEVPSVPDQEMYNPSVSCTGINMYIHFMKYYVPPTFSKL